MNDAPQHDKPAPSSRFQDSYERLRDQAVNAGAVCDREALAVLAGWGIAAWLDVLITLPAVAVAAKPRRPQSLPEDVQTHAVDILLTMLRPHMPGRTP